MTSDIIFRRPDSSFHAIRIRTQKVVRDPIRTAPGSDSRVGLPVGVEGEFYLGTDRSTILDFKRPSARQPGLWCAWIPVETLERTWIGSSPFPNYVPWLQCLITTFLIPNGYILNGTVTYEGKDSGRIIVENNQIRVEPNK